MRNVPSSLGLHQSQKPTCLCLGFLPRVIPKDCLPEQVTGRPKEKIAREAKSVASPISIHTEEDLPKTWAVFPQSTVCKVFTIFSSFLLPSDSAWWTSAGKAFPMTDLLSRKSFDFLKARPEWIVGRLRTPNTQKAVTNHKSMSTSDCWTTCNPRRRRRHRVSLSLPVSRAARTAFRLQPPRTIPPLQPCHARTLRPVLFGKKTWNATSACTLTGTLCKREAF